MIAQTFPSPSPLPPPDGLEGAWTPYAVLIVAVVVAGLIVQILRVQAELRKTTQLANQADVKADAALQTQHPQTGAQK